MEARTYPNRKYVRHELLEQKQDKQSSLLLPCGMTML